MTFITITENTFDQFMQQQGYVEYNPTKERVIAVLSDKHDIVVKEKVYSKTFNSVEIRVFSSVDLNTHVTRASGEDAIRVIIWHKTLLCPVTGINKTLRVGNMPQDVFGRLTGKLVAMEQRAIALDKMYSVVDQADIKDYGELVGKYAILINCVKGKTKKGSIRYTATYVTNCKWMSKTVKLLTNYMNNANDNIGDLCVIKSMGTFTQKVYERSVLLIVGRYSYTFPDSDDGLELEPVQGVVEQTIRTEEGSSFPSDTTDGLALLLDTTTPTVKRAEGEKSQEVGRLSEPLILSAPEPTWHPSSSAPTKDNYYGLELNFDLNPMQKMVWENGAIQKNENVVLSSPTAGGKTVVALFGMAKAMSSYQAAVYSVPTKALAEEKYKEFCGTFPNLKVVVMTGDYELSERMYRELEEADIIVCTYEMLAVRAIKNTSEKSKFIENTGCLVVDEIHTIASEKRGHIIETMLIVFTNVNPKTQLILLSATIDKLEIFKDWLEKITGRETAVLKSDYRPCKLNVEYRPYTYEKYPSEFESRWEVVSNIIKQKHGEKFLVFCPSRNDSVKFCRALEKEGYRVEYHNATLSLEERREIEREFKEGDLQIICSTPTLSVGINLPARNVLITSVYRGMTEMDPIEIHQSIGRAGRPQYDTEGFAYVLIPVQEWTQQIARLTRINVNSVLNKERDLLFHLNNLIYMGAITDTKSATDWWHKTFAYHLNIAQHDDFESLVRDTIGTDIRRHIDTLVSMGMIETDTTTGTYHCTELGRISALLFHYPDDILAWRDQWKGVANDGTYDMDVLVSKALVHPSQMLEAPYVSKDERDELMEFFRRYRKWFGMIWNDNDLVKLKYAYYNYQALHEEGSRAVRDSIRSDVERWFTAIKMLDRLYNWGMGKELDVLELRFLTGCKPEHCELVRLRGIGRVRAEKLYDVGLRTPQDIISSQKKVIEVLGENVGKMIIKSARVVLK